MTILIMIAIIAVLSGGLFFSIKGNISQKKDIKEKDELIKTLKIVSEKVAKIENKKTEIREKYNDQENDITNNNTSVILPNDEKPRHNHNFGSPCGKGCPAYSG